MPTFTTQGLRLSYDEQGSGEPVVLLHGFTSLASTWTRRGIVQALVERGLRAVALDARSHGASDPVFDPAMCTTDVLASDVVGLLDHLGIASATLVGFSMGGAVAIRVALDTPQRVSRMVVGGVGDSAINALHDPDEVRALAAAFSGRTVPLEGSAAAKLLRNAEGAHNDPRALLPFLEQGGWPGGLTDIQPLTVPALVIVAEADEYMASSEALLTALRPSDVLHVPARGHHDVLGDDAVRNALVRFITAPTELGRVASAGSAR